MEESVALVTVKIVEPLTPWKVAVMVVGPAARVWAKPAVGPVLAMVALVVSEEVQVAWVVMIPVLPSKYVAVAVNCTFVSMAADGLTGVTAMLFTGLVTVSVLVPVWPSSVALMVVVPGATPVARPPFAVIVALVGSEEAQVTWLVMSLPRLSLALNCWVAPGAMLGF